MIKTKSKTIKISNVLNAPEPPATNFKSTNDRTYNNLNVTTTNKVPVKRYITNSKPGTPGEIVLNNVNNQFYGYTGNGWVALNGGGTAYASSLLGDTLATNVVYSSITTVGTLVSTLNLGNQNITAVNSIYSNNFYKNNVSLILPVNMLFDRFTLIVPVSTSIAFDNNPMLITNTTIVSTITISPQSTNNILTFHANYPGCAGAGPNGTTCIFLFENDTAIAANYETMISDWGMNVSLLHTKKAPSTSVTTYNIGLASTVLWRTNCENTGNPLWNGIVSGIFNIIEYSV